jgi:1,4-dihydroxy-2-naphthoate octaprenyltransferase
VFRASTPLVVSLCDYAFLGRQLPDLKTWLALLGLLAGACGYVYTGGAVEVRVPSCSLETARWW